MGELDELETPYRPANVVNDTILRYGDSRSLEELSAMLGGILSPAEVGAHAQKLLSSRNWLTAAQKDQAVTLKMQDLLTELEDLGNGGLDRDKILGLRLRALKEIGARLDRRRAATEVDLNTYDANVGRVIGRVVDQTLSYMKGALREKVDPDLWDSLVIEAMRDARAEIAKHEAVED